MLREPEIEAGGAEVAAPHAHAVEVDERVLVVHREGRGLELEALVDEPLAQPMAGREAHGAELAVHASGEATVRVDPPAETVARLEQGDPMARFLQQQARDQSSHARADDGDVAARRIGLGQTASKRLEQVDAGSHDRSYLRTSAERPTLALRAGDRPRQPSQRPIPLADPVAPSRLCL